jgi:hypothetical protein
MNFKLEMQEAKGTEEYFSGKVDEFLEDLVPQLSNKQVDHLLAELEQVMRERTDLDLYAEELPF